MSYINRTKIRLLLCLWIAIFTIVQCIVFLLTVTYYFYLLLYLLAKFYYFELSKSANYWSQLIVRVEELFEKANCLSQWILHVRKLSETGNNLSLWIFESVNYQQFCNRYRSWNLLNIASVRPNFIVLRPKCWLYSYACIYVLSNKAFFNLSWTASKISNILTPPGSNKLI